MYTFPMDQLARAGDAGIHFKIRPELRVACRRYKIKVSRIAREAVAAAVREAARREAMGKRGA